MDFNTYLKEVHGYQKGDRISADKARQLKVQFANAENVAAAQNANANAIKTSISLEVENAAKKGTPIDPRIIEDASNLFNTGQFKEAQSLISNASKNIAETTKQQSEVQQTELENKNLTLQQNKLQQEQQDLISQKESVKNTLIESLKNKYQDILSAKNDPYIKNAFGMPIDFSDSPSRLIPGTQASVASVKINQLANQDWIRAIIDAKGAGATFGALSDKEGDKLSSAASLLSSPASLNYDTGNKELQKMAESVKKLYKEATGKDISEEVKTEAATPLTAGQQLRAKIPK